MKFAMGYKGLLRRGWKLLDPAKNLAIIGVPTQVLNAFKLGMNRNLPAMDLDELGSCLYSVAPGSRGLKAHK